MKMEQKKSFLLALPVELFQLIIESLVEIEGLYAAKYCLVNKSFAITLKDKILEHASRKSFEEILEWRDLAFVNLFYWHTATLLIKKAVYNDQNGEKLIQFAREVGKRIAKRVSVDSAEILDRHYTIGICECFGSLKLIELMHILRRFDTPNSFEIFPFSEIKIDSHLEQLLPAIVSAVDDTATLSQIIKDPVTILESTYEWSPRTYFPHPLSAAVASDNIPVLNWYLDGYNAKKPKPDPAFVTAVHEALDTAIRLHKNEAGAMILEFIAEKQERFHSMSFSLSWLFTKALWSNDTALLHRICELRHSAKSAAARQFTIRMNYGDLRYIFDAGKKDLLTTLLRNRHFDPNALLEDTRVPPLQVAFESDFDSKRGDLAALLISHGADVYAPVRQGSRYSVFWHAVASHHDEDVRVMLACGAELKKACPKGVFMALNRALVLSRFRRTMLFRLSQSQEGRKMLARRDLSMQDLQNLL